MSFFYDRGENDNVSASNVDLPTAKPNSEAQQNQQQSDDPSSSSSGLRGVRQDLSEFIGTLKPLWVTILMPQPRRDFEHSIPFDEVELMPDRGRSDAVGPAGMWNDFMELGGKFRSGISELSDNMAVSGIKKIASRFSKIASNILQMLDEEANERCKKGAVGVTEGVVAYASGIAMHPETWLNFHLPEDEDFYMSDAQRCHALGVEHFAPRLAALRNYLCSGHMSETHFWKIYFILVHPKLEKEDAELLSTPQIAKSLALLGQDLPKCTEANPQDCRVIPNQEFLSVPPCDVSGYLVQGTSSSESTASAPIKKVNDVSLSDLEEEDNYVAMEL